MSKLFAWINTIVPDNLHLLQFQVQVQNHSPLSFPFCDKEAVRGMPYLWLKYGLRDQIELGSGPGFPIYQQNDLG